MLASGEKCLILIRDKVTKKWTPYSSCYRSEIVRKLSDVALSSLYTRYYDAWIVVSAFAGTSNEICKSLNMDKGE